MKFFIYTALLFIMQAAQAQQDVMHQKYGTAEQNTLDLFLPADVTPKTPVLIVIHGGAWMQGGNEYTEKTARDLRNRGFVVANVDYRFVNDSVDYTGLLKDIDNAVGKVDALSGTYNYSTANGYHVMGISAGAHLSLLYGYTTTRKIKSITALCPPTRLDDEATLAFLQKHNLVKNIEYLTNAKYTPGKAVPKAFTAASPYAHVNNIPTLLYHGDSDNLVPLGQSEFMLEKLREKNVESALIVMPGKGHDVGMNDPVTEEQILTGITAWVNGHR